MLGAVMIQLVLLHLSGRTDSGDVEIDPNNEYRAIWDAKAHPRDMVSAVGLYSLGDQELDRVDLSKLLLFPEEHQYLDFTDPLSVENVLRGIFESIDGGFDHIGNPTGGGGDGELTRGEVAHRVAAVTRTWQEISNDDWIAETDQDLDVLLTEVEIVARNDSSSPTTISHRFRAADRDADGWLAETENWSGKVDHFRHPLWFDRMHTVLAILTVAALDLDHNLVVSRSEFEALGAAHIIYKELYSDLPPLPSASLGLEFATLDTDGSSDLSVTEMNAFVATRETVLLSVLVDKLFRKLDGNDDNVLMIDEVSAQHKQLWGDTLPQNACGIE